jgi:Concanavalin A-like lectin/glucanases superfamily
MRKSLVGYATIALATVALVGASPASAATTKTLALYNLNQAPGSTVLVDSSGNGHNGTIGAHSPLDGTEQTFPYHNGALGGSVDMAHLDLVPSAGLVPGTGDYSVTLRLKFTQPLGNVINYGQSDGHGMVKVQLDDKGGRATCQFVGSLGSGAIASPNPINDGQWHVLTCARTATKVQLTIDGVIVARIGHATGNIAPKLPFSIGGKSSCTALGAPHDCDYFDGVIDYVEIQTS